MKQIKYWLLIPWFVSATLAFGQQTANTTNNPEEEETIVLSPFTVDGSDDIGYRATSTLAGTRIRTDLSDIGSSISVVNKEFLEDTGSTNIGDVLLFTPNTEVSGINGNYSGVHEAGAGVLIPEIARDNQTGGTTRIRGLAGADLTRNYFITNLPFDTYNVDRVEVQRGANSALFGLGSPGGIVNHATVLPRFDRNHSRIRFEGDQYGTLRGSFRTNQVYNDRVAVNVSGLYSDRKFEQEEAFELDQRLYGAINIKVIEGISIFGNVESGKRDRSAIDATPPNDGITPWLEMGKPVFDSPQRAGSMYRGTGDFLPGQPNSRLLTLAQSGTSSGYVSIYGDPNDPAPTNGVLAFGRTNTGLPNLYPDVGTGEWMHLQPRNSYEIVRLTGFWPDGTAAAPGEAAYFARNNVGQQILDRSIFDYREHLFSGGSSQQHMDWLVYQVGVEGRWFEDRLGVELAYSDEDSEDSGYNSLQGAYQRTIYIDPNQYLIGTTNADGTTDGMTNLLPNPGYGQPTMGGLWGGNRGFRKLVSKRATGFAEGRATDIMDEGLMSDILGRFKLTGLLEKREIKDEQHYARDQLNAQAVAGATYPGGAINGTAAPNFGVFRAGSQYVLPYSGGQDLLAGTSLSDYSGINIGAVPFGEARDRPPAYMTYQGWSTDDNAFVNFDSPTYTLEDGLFPATFSSSKRNTEIDSKVLVGQWYVWEDTLVLTGSWRDDVSKTAGVGAPGSSIHPRSDNIYDPTYVAGPINLEENGSRSTTSWSAMLHTPQFLREKLPWGTHISLYMSEADNFSPGGGGVYIDNTSIPATTGNTEEAGIIVSTMNGKLVGRFNWYETGVLNKTFDAGGVSANEGILRGLVTGTVRQENIDNGWTVADSQAVLPPQGVLDLNQFEPDWTNGTVETNRDSNDNGTQDFVSKGFEWEINYNPTTSWTWLLSVGEQETITSNTYPVLRPYAEGFVKTNWVDSAFAQSFIINDTGETLAQVAQRNILDPVARAVLQDGFPQIEQRKLRVNINTSYNFGADSGLPDWLGDLTVGGGYRWQDQVGVGFGVSQTELGDYIQDVNKPIYGGAIGTIDLFVRSRFEFSNEQSLTVQLTIGDLLDNQDLVPIYANPDGSKVYRFMEGRMFNFSATYEF